MADLEAWLRGPVADIPPVLQPAAHALVQVRDDVDALAPSLDTALLWDRPGAASAGFHLLHLVGALDRLLTYARGEALNDTQRAALRAESDTPDLDGRQLSAMVSHAVDRALAQLRGTDLETLFHERRVGRSAASTVIGLVFHAAEHSTRHAGQFITTVKILQSGRVEAAGAGG